MSYVAHDESAFVRPAEVEEVELYHPRTFIGKYIWSQDAKVIALQYAVTAIAIGLVALVLSWLMRLQLGFPGRVGFIDPSTYLQFVSMHGMIMVIYLLTALFLGGFGNYLSIRSAVRIGLIPNLPPDRVSYVGNAAGLGAQMALVSETERRRADDLARQIQHVSLADHPDFQDVFLEAVTFPEA